MPSSSINAVCSELLSTNDLTISDELFKRIIDNKIITLIIDDVKQPSINIYATSQLYLSSILPILHDFGFTIIDEVAYKILKNKQHIYINRFNLMIDDKKKITDSKDNIESVISDSLNGTILSRCKLFSLVYDENLCIRKVLLLRAMIEYINQSVIALNQETILHTITTHSRISKLFVEYFISKFDPKISKREYAINKIK